MLQIALKNIVFGIYEACIAFLRNFVVAPILLRE
jgi:hypothetical protein